MKPTSTFKLSKPAKCALALGKFKSQEERNAWKRMLIDAQLASEASRNRRSNDSD